MSKPNDTAILNLGLPILEGLLGSKTRARLLVVFATHPAQEFLAPSLSDETRLSLTSVRYELPRLARLGLVTVRSLGRDRLYCANERHLLFPEIKEMVYKTAGLGDVVRKAVEGAPGIEAAFVYGSVARGEEKPTSDIDLFVLGHFDRQRLSASLSQAERQLDREINLVTMSVDEWRKRDAAKEGFIRELRQAPKIFLVGDEQSLPRT
jgi:predicted nucleotidyltransferase